MSKIGLVFAGGGGKGAYEIGVWKAFKEFGVDKNIACVSGTSVGGLNGALFAKGDFEQALKVWEMMSPEKILQINPAKVLSLLSKFNLPANVLTTLGNKLGFLKSEGVFTQKGLESIIRDSLKEGELKDKIPLYVCATDVSSKLSWKPLYKKLNELAFEDTLQYLLATSAIPVAFPTTIVEDVELLDGFLTDNTPMKPLIEIEGCDKIFVVLLGRSESIVQEKLKYPDVDFWEIVPSGDTKEGLGSLDFKSETANTLIDIGYTDTQKILQNLYEFMLIEKEYIKKGETLRVQESGFKKQTSNNSLLREEYKQLQNSYRDMSSLEYLLSSKSATKKALVTQNISNELALSLDSFDMELIDSKLDTILDEMADNSEEMAKFAFEGVTSLASNDGKIAYQINQGRFSRFMGSITGSDHRLQADINHNFSKSIYANTQMIKKLAMRNNLTLDVCISLGNRVNFLAQNQNQLQEQNNQQLKMMGSLRDALMTLSSLTRNAIQSNSSRIEKLEYSHELLNWSHHLNSSIKGLNSYESIVKIVSSFYEITQNSHDDSATEFLYATLVNSGFDDVSINPSAFLEYVIDNETLKESANFLQVPKSYEASVPLFSSVSKIYEKNRDIKLNDVMSSLEVNYGINLDVDISGVDFAFELLSGFKVSGDMKVSLRDSKRKMTTSLKSIEAILEDDKIDTFIKDIANLVEKVESFKVVVPIIGKFSSGKSKLLNSYISPDDKLFEVDTNPTTALPCEIRYGTENIVKIYDKENNVTEVALGELPQTQTSNTKYLQYFLNYKKLQNRDSLVIVDMPGFESSNLNHNNAINRYFNRGNHYILALNCETANDSSILKHIKEILSYGAKFSVLITKADKKLPKDIDEIVKVVKQNIVNKYPNEEFFIGVTSAFKNNLDDFEKIIDAIYEDAPLIFENKFKKDLNLLTSEIINYYKGLLNAPNDLIEFEKKITSDKNIFDKEVSKLNLKLKQIRFEIVSDAQNTLTDKIEAVLSANISSLVSSAKNSSLSQTITELLRAPLNSSFKKIVDDSLRSIEDEALSISNDLTISFSSVQIDTNLSIWGSIKNFIFNTQNDDIGEELNRSVIPTVINDMSKTIEIELQNLYESIEKSVNEKMSDKREKAETLASEIKDKIVLQTKEYDKLQEKLQVSLQQLQKEG